MSSCLNTACPLVSAKKLANYLQTSVGLQMESVWAYSFYPNLPKVWWKKSKTFNKVGWKTPCGNKSWIHGLNLSNDAFFFFMWVIGHMKVKDQRQRFEFLDREVASVVYKAATSCYVQPHTLHDEWSEAGLSLFHSFRTKLTDDNDQLLEFLFSLVWTVFSKRGEQGLML